MFVTGAEGSVAAPSRGGLAARTELRAIQAHPHHRERGVEGPLETWEFSAEDAGGVRECDHRPGGSQSPAASSRFPLQHLFNAFSHLQGCLGVWSGLAGSLCRGLVRRATLSARSTSHSPAQKRAKRRRYMVVFGQELGGVRR